MKDDRFDSGRCGGELRDVWFLIVIFDKRILLGRLWGGEEGRVLGLTLAAVEGR